ncbi:MAG: hypothetical protein ACREF3_08575, partial [Acetobacteraceae bacterium]
RRGGYGNPGGSWERGGRRPTQHRTGCGGLLRLGAAALDGIGDGIGRPDFRGSRRWGAGACVLRVAAADAGTDRRPRTATGCCAASPVAGELHHPLMVRAAHWLLAKRPWMVDQLLVLPQVAQITRYVINRWPRGFWTDRGYNWFSGI